MRFHPLVAAALAALLLGACRGKGPKPFGGEIPKIVHLRVVSLSPNITEIVSLVNGEVKLVGRTSGCDYPETPQIQEIPIVANPTPDVEKILRSQADLILVDADLINNSYIRKFEEAGIETEIIRIHSLNDWEAAVEKIGNLLMQQRAASDATDDLNAVRHLGETDPINPPPKVALIMGPQKPMAAGTASFQADVVKAAGGVMVGPDEAKWVPIDAEQLMQWNPDVIVVPGDAAPYEKMEIFASKVGGGKRKIIGINESILLRAGARVKDLIRGIHDELMKAAHN